MERENPCTRSRTTRLHGCDNACWRNCNPFRKRPLSEVPRLESTENGLKTCAVQKRLERSNFQDLARITGVRRRRNYLLHNAPVN